MLFRSGVYQGPENGRYIRCLVSICSSVACFGGSIILFLSVNCGNNRHKQKLSEVEVVRINSYLPESANRYQKARLQ